MLNRAPREKPRWLRECLAILHGEFAKPLTVAAFAARSGVHPVHLGREFRRRHGMTMGEYLQVLRVQQACEQLQRADATLVAVALCAGFADQSHLCRVFKKWVGCSPGLFRALHRRLDSPLQRRVMLLIVGVLWPHS